MSASSFHVCACGASYTKRAWQRLTFTGWLFVPETAGSADYRLELRACRACGSTRATEVPNARPSRRRRRAALNG